MGIWLFSSFNEGAKNSIFKGSGGAVSGAIGKTFGFAKDAFVKSTNAIAYGAGKIGLKTPLIAGTLLAAGAGVAMWMNGKNKEKARDSLETLRAGQMQSTQADIMALQQQNAAMMNPAVGGNTLMGLQPVAGDHANRVLAARGGNMGVDVSNPNMTAANFEAARS